MEEGFLKRMREGSRTFTIIAGKFIERRHLRRYEWRWEDDIKIVIKEIVSMKCDLNLEKHFLLYNFRLFMWDRLPEN